METTKRVFRGKESLEAEEKTRNSVSSFLKDLGFSGVDDQRTTRGTATSQSISATSPDGMQINARIRLCWRRTGKHPREKRYSAAQLRARLKEQDWEKTIAFINLQDKTEEHTHTLFLQRDGEDFVFAALVPTDQLPVIWRGQRDVSKQLIEEGKMGRIHKNHAMNGASPTIWLQDDRTPHAHLVADVLWDAPGVINLLEKFSAHSTNFELDDTFDDCPVDTSLLGRDAGERRHETRSGYKRDARVREQVLLRAHGACERIGCGAKRSFSGFLDVHHILGVGNSDRVSNCVALCPNCHREAHFAPNKADINQELLDIAKSRS